METMVKQHIKYFLSILWYPNNCNIMNFITIFVVCICVCLCMCMYRVGLNRKIVGVCTLDSFIVKTRRNKKMNTG